MGDFPNQLKDFDLRGRVAIVTGGARGIGRATAEHFARAGAAIVINYLKDEAAAKSTAAALEDFGVRVHAVRADVSEARGAEKLVRETAEVFGRLDILVCNAGIWEGAPVEQMSEELWDRVLGVNLRGTWTVCRQAVPLMKDGGYGRIVVVSSTAGQRGEAFYAGYAASKGGQISFVKSLAVELAPFNINVNAVAPGWVDTEMTSGALGAESGRASIASGIPLGRPASPDDVALPILFLCSSWARHITGEVLNVNGGAVLCG
ncbi:MAG TPA: 3-oxoacyl-ACP reductase family protein [Pyrinomonadaceae bacterium]|jgi:3-oxoacyl-[acyl-carrier protein] reductase|nr:3-oxoacyl-ACP reductase family protein [Pyrinomonadaceae bacterium]